MHERRVIGILCLLAVSLGLTAALALVAQEPGTLQETRDPKPLDLEGGVVLTKDQMPIGSLVRGWIQLYAYELRTFEEGAERALERVGLDPDLPSVKALPKVADELASRFGPQELGRRYRAARSKEGGIAAEEEQAIRLAYTLERAEFEGRTIGNWLHRLDEDGVEVEAFLRRLVDHPTFNMNLTFVNEEPDMARLAQEDAEFRAAASAALGRPLKVGEE